MPGLLMSYVYMARPVTFSLASSRGIAVLTTFRLSIALQGRGSLSGISNSTSSRFPLNPKSVLIFCGILLSSLHPSCCCERCIKDVRVGAAAAEIARYCGAHIFQCRISIAIEQRLARHNHSRRAETALQSVVLDKSLLQRM